MKLNKFIIFYFVFFSTLVMSKEAPISWSGNLYKHMNTYKALHAKFSKELCPAGTEPKYNTMLRNYRGSGFYLPLQGDDIDRKAILENLEHYKKKITFIEKAREKLVKQEKLPSFNEISKNLKTNLDNLLDFKKEYSQASSNKNKTKIRDKSNKELVELKKNLDQFMEDIFFLKSYNFPNDHLQNRREFELYKDKSDKQSVFKANKIFFFRRLVEDGAMDKDHTRSDFYIRSTLDTLYLTIKREKDFISENLRYDLDWSLRQIERLFERGYQVQLERLSEWLERTKLNYNFYHDIVKVQNHLKAKELVKQKNQATLKLKEFVYRKQAQTYEWWMKQSELMQAIFVLETILFNEVGTVDGEDALERYDVAQIVMNRVQDDFYSTLDPKQEIIKYLNIKQFDSSKYRWLNTLFRVGEFSFTYHYIGGVAKIFCPDMSYLGKKLRDKNIKISLKSIRDYRKDFNVYRYFSRVSMLGKIDMSSVWFDYEPYPERAGFEVLNQRQLIRYYLANRYQYLYSFTDPDGETFQVIKIGEDTYSMRWEKGRPKFYNYRDPHLFKYFLKK